MTRCLKLTAFLIALLHTSMAWTQFEIASTSEPPQLARSSLDQPQDVGELGSYPVISTGKV